MIIGFWSELPEKGSVTYNMIASAVSISYQCDRRIILIQGKYDENRIDYAFTPYMEENMIREEYGYYSYGGIDSMINKFENNRFDEHDLEKELVRIQNSNLYYLPSTRKKEKGLFDRKFRRISSQMLRTFQKFCGDRLLFIDLGSGWEDFDGDLLTYLDLLVVNIPQENIALRGIRENTGLMERAVFIIGRYDDRSEFNVRNIYRKYRIDQRAIGVVPYNIQYRDAVVMGKTKDFFDRNRFPFFSRGYDENKLFMKQLDCTVGMILERCQFGGYRTDH